MPGPEDSPLANVAGSAGQKDQWLVAAAVDSGGSRFGYSLGDSLLLRLDRLAFDLALADQPQSEHRTRETQQRTERQHIVQAGKEAVAGRDRDRVASRVRHCAKHL